MSTPKPAPISPFTVQELERLRPKTVKPLGDMTLTVRHTGGELRQVDVLDATPDGAIHVRWSSGAGVYVIHVFRAIGERGAGHLFHTARSRIPLAWQVVGLESARDLWRRMTGRKDVMTKEERFARRAGRKA